MQLFVLNFCELQFSQFSCQFRLIQMQLEKQKEPFVKWTRILLNTAASQNTSSVVRTLICASSACVSAQASRQHVNRHDAGNVSLIENILYFCFEKHTQVGGARGRARERGAGLRGRGITRTLERNMGGACHSLSLSEQRGTRGRMCWSHGGARCFENALVSSRNVRNEAWTARLDRTHTHTHVNAHAEM